MNTSLCGAGAPARETSKAKIIKGRATAIEKAVTRAFALLIAALREIFDESAYDRFLERGSLTSSSASYASFCEERDHTRARRPRCC